MDEQETVLPVYVWQDRQDVQAIHLGIKSKNDTFLWWQTLYLDAIHDLFGRVTYEEMRSRIGLEPVEVRLRLTIVG